MSWYNYIETGAYAQIIVNNIPIIKRGRSKLIKVNIGA